MNRDEELLDLLPTFYTALAVLVALSSLFPLLLAMAGLGMAKSTPAEAVGTLLGVVITVVAAAITLGSWIIAFMMLDAAGRLRERKDFRFCLIVAGVSCLAFPLGAILGAFTYYVLLRPGIRELFPPPRPASADREFRERPPPPWARDLYRP